MEIRRSHTKPSTGTAPSNDLQRFRQELLRDAAVEFALEQQSPRRAVGVDHVVFLLDESSSMHGDKLNEMKSGAIDVIQQLPSGLTLTVVGFATAPTVVSEPSSDRRQAMVRIERLRADGGTALHEALELLESRLAKSGSSLIHVVSDGNTDNPSLALASGARLKSRGHIIWCTGVTGADEKFLQALAGGELTPRARVVASKDLRSAIVSDTLALPVRRHT